MGLKQEVLPSGSLPSGGLSSEGLHARLPVLLQADAYFSEVTNISLAYLQARAIRALLLDVDDTLVAKHDSHCKPSQPLRNWLADLRAAEIKVMLLSNGRGTRVREWARALEIEGIALAAKPLPWAYCRALQALELPAKQVAMVGDQLFTDILGANIMAMPSIWVEARSTGAGITRVLRHLEAPLRQHYRAIYSPRVMRVTNQQ